MNCVMLEKPFHAMVYVFWGSQDPTGVMFLVFHCFDSQIFHEIFLLVT